MLRRIAADIEQSYMYGYIPLIWPTWGRLVCAFLVILVIGVTAGVLEGRMTESWNFSRSLIIAACWVTAATAALGVVSPFHHMSYHIRVDWTMAIVCTVAIGFAGFAVIARLCVHWLVVSRRASL